MGLLDRVAVSALPLLPKAVMWRVASRYIAGEHLDDALRCLEDLQGKGFTGILDMLGEDVVGEAGARAVAVAYAEAVEKLAARNLDAYVSVKPTHVGLRESEDLCFELYRDVALACKRHGRDLRVEMEDHTTTDGTLRVFERLRAEFDNVGIVLQARLFRTSADIAALAPGPLSVRLVKGIYLEPEEIAHVDPEPIREAYLRNCRELFERGAYVSLATHDGPMADRLLALAKEMGVGPDRYEFQVLLGVQAPLWARWRDAGHPVRVYVPYGSDWRAYSTRRLDKNPQIFWHVTKDLLTFWK